RNTDELVLQVADDIKEVRVAAGTGIVGTCARTRQIINVPDCYADARFDASTDKRTGYRTRCLLTLPLVDHKGILVAVMQLLNKADGVFDAADESLGRVLAAQCAVALQRTSFASTAADRVRSSSTALKARSLPSSSRPASRSPRCRSSAYGPRSRSSSAKATSSRSSPTASSSSATARARSTAKRA